MKKNKEGLIKDEFARDCYEILENAEVGFALFKTKRYWLKAIEEAYYKGREAEMRVRIKAGQNEKPKEETLTLQDQLDAEGEPVEELEESK